MGGRVKNFRVKILELNLNNSHFFLLFFVSCMMMNAQERTVLRHDRPQGCFPGDTIHAEVSVLADSNAQRSGVVYVDLLNAQGEMLQLKRLKVRNGKAACAFVIDPFLFSGYYELRAYTRGMMMRQYVLRQEGDRRARIYASQVVPVFRLEDKVLVQKGSAVRHLDASSCQERHKELIYRHDWNWRCGNPQYQWTEQGLTFVGHLEPRAEEPTEADYEAVKGRRLSVIIGNGETVHLADVTTDEYGRFACEFPDVDGEWICRVVAAHGEDLRKYRVVNDCLFSPPVRPYDADELVVEGLNVRNEKNRWKGVYVHCDANVEMAKGLGLVSQDFYEWLLSLHLGFLPLDGLASPHVMNAKPEVKSNMSLDLNLQGRSSDDLQTVCTDGLVYVRKGSWDSRQPVVWIVNGAYRLMTGMEKKVTAFRVLRPTRTNIPLSVDEVRSVFVTEDPRAYRPYVECAELEHLKPVTVFINLHEHFLMDDAALYCGYFYGFDN